jgi:hypothetical protein
MTCAANVTNTNRPHKSSPALNVVTIENDTLRGQGGVSQPPFPLPGKQARLG